MKNSTIITMATVIVAVILTGSVLIPVIEQAQSVGIKKTVSFSNEGDSLIEGDVSETYNIQWDSALPGTIKINNPTPTVYFIAGSDATVNPNSKTVVKDLTYGDLPVPVRAGYTFDGWYTSQQYTTQVTSDSIVTSSSDVILYAKWVANEYTVTFDADGGSVSPSTKTVTFGSAYGELPVPTYTGHIFGGWFDENDNPITAQTLVSIPSDHTLTAVWTLEQYLVSFTTDGNGTVDTQSILVDYGTSYTISDNTVTIGSTTITATPNSGYVWGSWIPSNSGVIESATVFTANFIQPPVTLSFSAQSPGSVDIQTIPNVNIGTQYIITDNVITVVGYDTVTANLEWGYYFTGWDAPQGTGIVTEATSFNAEYEPIIVKKFVIGQSSSSSLPNEWILTTDGKLFHCKGSETSKLFVLHPFEGVVADIYTSSVTTWIITDDGKLYGYGNNQYGQQGDGTTTYVNDFTQRLSGESIKKVFAGQLITWVLTTDGKLFGCGYNDRGGQGTGSTSPRYVSTFTQRLAGEQIADITVGEASLESTVWAITSDGRLFGWGYNGSGQQGDGTTNTVTTPTQRLADQTVSKVYSAETSTWVITTDGKLFGCGYNHYGQQGDGTKNNVLNFTQRLTDHTIKDVVTAYASTWVITTDGKLFGCGYNHYGQQGDGTVGTDVTSFTQRLSDVSQGIECGSASNDTTWVITTDGKLFGCGKNNSGQQGDGTTNTVKTFKQRFNSGTIKEVFAYSDNTWVLTMDNKLYCTGDNQYGQQGDGTITQVKNFTQRGPAVINLPTPTPSQQISHLNVHNSLTPMTPVLTNTLGNRNVSIDPSNYIFHAGGNDWMLCSVSIGQDEYALALYYAGLTSPLLWTDDVELVFSNGVLNAENNGSYYVMNYTTIYFKGEGGKYVLMSDSAHVSDETEIIGYSLPTSDSGIEFKGTLEDMQAISISDGSITIGDLTIETEDTEYDGIYTITELSATYGDDGTAMCSSMIVPKQVFTTIETENHALMSVLWVLPIIVLAGIMIFLIRSLINRYE